MRMKESDWKKFKIIREQAIERFCSRALEEFEKVISNSTEHVHNRYLLLTRLVQNSDKQMNLIFDGYSKAKAPLQLIVIRARGLADEALIAELSEELREDTDPGRHGWL